MPDDSTGQAGASLGFIVPPDAIDAGVEALSQFEPDTGVPLSELALRVFEAVFQRLDAMSKDCLADRDHLLPKFGKTLR